MVPLYMSGFDRIRFSEDVLLGVDETFYRDQISVCTCVPVSMK